MWWQLPHAPASPSVASVPRRTITHGNVLPPLWACRWCCIRVPRDLIRERMLDVAAEQGLPFEPVRQDDPLCLNMGIFPGCAALIRKPYNKMAGFSPGHVRVMHGFPVTAWPTIEWQFDQHYLAKQRGQLRLVERSVIVFGALEATQAPCMENIEQRFGGVKVVSLPCVDPGHEWGRHIELGVKGSTAAAHDALVVHHQGLVVLAAKCGPEMVRRWCRIAL